MIKNSKKTKSIAGKNGGAKPQPQTTTPAQTTAPIITASVAGKPALASVAPAKPAAAVTPVAAPAMTKPVVTQPLPVKSTAVSTPAAAPVASKPVVPAAAPTVKPLTAPPPPPAPVAKAPVAIPSRKVGRISFELLKPEAKAVCVAGSFNGWKPEQAPLVRTGNGRWVGEMTVNPGKYEYLFVVDGQWIPDPNAKETVQNPFGGRNSVLTVSE